MARKLLISLSLVAALNFIPAVQTTASARIELSDNESQGTKIEQRGNSVIISGAAGKMVYIYDIVAVVKKVVAIDAPEKRIDLSQLPKGVYLIKVGNDSKRILIGEK